MFLGMPGLNGDSYPASQVRRPTSSFLFLCCVHDGEAGICATAHMSTSQGNSVGSVLPSLSGRSSDHQTVLDKHLYLSSCATGPISCPTPNSQGPL